MKKISKIVTLIAFIFSLGINAMNIKEEKKSWYSSDKPREKKSTEKKTKEIRPEHKKGSKKKSSKGKYHKKSGQESREKKE